MALKFPTVLLTIALISLLRPQSGVECNTHTHAHSATSDCRQHHSFKGAQRPYRTQQLLRNTGLDDKEENVEDFQLSSVNRRELLELIQTGKVQLKAESDKEAQQRVRDFFQDNDEADSNERGSKRKPWRKVLRIVRRQLIKVPKRYLKKFIRTGGLRASARFDDFVALPIDEEQSTSPSSTVNGVGILMRTTKSQNDENEYSYYEIK